MIVFATICTVVMVVSIFLQDLGDFKVMTANLHLLLAHGAEYVK